MKRTHFTGKFAALAVILTVLLACMMCAAFCEESGFTSVPEVLRPGKTVRLSYISSAEGNGKCVLTDAAGQEWEVSGSLNVIRGENHLIWDGLLYGETCAEPGEYTLLVLTGTETIITPLKIGEPAPRIISAEIGEADQNGLRVIDVRCSQAGRLTVTAEVNGESAVIYDGAVLEGDHSFVWDGGSDRGSLPEGEYMLQFCLTDGEGFSGTKQNRHVNVTSSATLENERSLNRDMHTVIPSRQRTAEEENSYWTMTIGDLSDDKVWEILMQPMTVIDGDQTLVYRLRATPDKSTDKENIVGEVTYASQGVHVLEKLDNGWTKVEVYNSSYGPKCKSRRGFGVTNDLIVGYVETSKLKTITPAEGMGLVIDKLNQTMYIYEDGKLTGSLLVSTGLNNATQSWNETPSGEYVMISKIGGFAAGNLWCAYGMRINGGCAIHEVPYIGKEDTPSSRRDYSSTVKLLGQKASHGCIRVQRATNEAGQNIKWLWNNMKKYTKVLIWEDSGRFLDYPDDATELYYNPNGGQYYHEAQYCTGVKDRYLPLTAFTYGELESEPFASLKPCPNCCHTKRKGEIDELNRENGY